MKHVLRTTFILFVALVFVGCSIRPFQPPLSSKTVIDNNNTVVVLVGVVGPSAIDYIQFCHNGFPCFNYRNINLSNDVIALPMTVPMGNLELNSYTTANRPGYYLPNGVSYGYIGLDDKHTNLNEPGIYYHLTIDTTQSGKFFEKPTRNLLLIAKEKYGKALEGLKPLNFEWPE